MEQLKIIKITLFTLLFLLSCGGEIIESQWLAESIVIDGDAAEWENIPLYFNENLNVVYGIANDKTHIHFMIRFNDQQVARMFSARGFTLRFNENDEKNRGGWSGMRGARTPGGGMPGGGMRGGGMKGGRATMPDMDGEDYCITVKLADK